MTTAAPITQPLTTRSSLLYAMGRLEALHEAQAKDIEELPQRVADTMNPRIEAVEHLTGGFNKRLVSLERWNWVHVGTIGALVVLSGVAMGVAPQLIHIRL